MYLTGFRKSQIPLIVWYVALFVVHKIYCLLPFILKIIYIGNLQPEEKINKYILPFPLQIRNNEKNIIIKTFIFLSFPIFFQGKSMLSLCNDVSKTRKCPSIQGK